MKYILFIFLFLLINTIIAEQTLSLGDSVSVSVIRHRWYGTIYESGNNSDLSLFNLLSMPLKAEGFNMTYVYFFILIIAIFLSYYFFKNKSKSSEVIYE